jgi:hypothetical protein
LVVAQHCRRGSAQRAGVDPPDLILLAARRLALLSSLITDSSARIDVRPKIEKHGKLRCIALLVAGARGGAKNSPISAAHFKACLFANLATLATALRPDVARWKPIDGAVGRLPHWPLSRKIHCAFAQLRPPEGKHISGVTVADLARDGVFTVFKNLRHGSAQLTERGQWFARTLIAGAN